MMMKSGAEVLWTGGRRRARGWSVLTVAGIFVAGAAGCVRARYETIRFPSADGAFTLVATPNLDKADRTKYLCIRVQIVDKGGRAQYEELTSASVRLNWAAAWRSPRRVALDSSDVGILVWERGADGRWGRVPCAPGDPVLPLRHARCGPVF